MMRFVMPTGLVPTFNSEALGFSKKPESPIYSTYFGRRDASMSTGSASMDLSMDLSVTSGEENSSSPSSSAPLGRRDASMDLSVASGEEYFSLPSSTTPSYHSTRVKPLTPSRWDEQGVYQHIRHVGSGTYGTCDLLKRKSDSALRVVKVTKRVSVRKGAYEDEPLEAKILTDILPPHDRICRLHESIIGSRTVQLYFDYYSGGDLSNIIRVYQSNREMIPEGFLWQAFIQLAEAVAFMHSGYSRQSLCPAPNEWQPVFHGDIKPANIFLSPPNPDSMDPLCRLYPSLVLGDFGISSLRPAKRYGTLRYQPPEMPAVSGPSDVWAVGCVLHTLAHFNEPVKPLPESYPETQDAMLDWLAYPDSRAAIALFPRYSYELHDCVFETFEYDPKGRIKSVTLLKKVTDAYSYQVEPRLSYYLEPLIDGDFREKMFDENGVTLKTSDFEMDEYFDYSSDQEDAQFHEAMIDEVELEWAELDMSRTYFDFPSDQDEAMTDEIGLRSTESDISRTEFDFPSNQDEAMTDEINFGSTESHMSGGPDSITVQASVEVPNYKVMFKGRKWGAPRMCSIL